MIAWSQQIICIVVEYSTKNLPILHNLSDKKVFTKEVAVNFGGPYIGSGAKVTAKSEYPKLFLVHTFRIIHMVLHIYGNKKDIDIKANKI